MADVGEHLRLKWEFKGVFLPWNICFFLWYSTSKSFSKNKTTSHTIWTCSEVFQSQISEATKHPIELHLIAVSCFFFHSPSPKSFSHGWYPMVTIPTCVARCRSRGFLQVLSAGDRTGDRTGPDLGGGRWKELKHGWSKSYFNTYKHMYIYNYIYNVYILCICICIYIYIYIYTHYISKPYCIPYETIYIYVEAILNQWFHFTVGFISKLYGCENWKNKAYCQEKAQANCTPEIHGLYQMWLAGATSPQKESTQLHWRIIIYWTQQYAFGFISNFHDVTSSSNFTYGQTHRLQIIFLGGSNLWILSPPGQVSNCEGAANVHLKAGAQVLYLRSPR